MKVKSVESLRQLTSENHRKVEDKMESGRVLQPDFSYKEYRLFLLKHVEAYQLIEPLLIRKLQEPFMNEWLKFFTRRLGDLETELGIPEYSGKKNEKWDDESIHFYLGMLYVLKGSALGGMMIYKKLLNTSKNWRHSPDFLFFKPKSRNPVEDWQEFLSSLQSSLDNNNQYEDLKRGVDTTYQIFYDSATRGIAMKNA